MLYITLSSLLFLANFGNCSPVSKKLYLISVDGDFADPDIFKILLKQALKEEIDSSLENVVTDSEDTTEKNKKLLYPEYVHNFFEKADQNSDGQISYLESEQFAVNHLKIASDKKWKQFFDDFDKNGDGNLDITEFAKLMTSWYRGDPNLTFIGYKEKSSEEDISAADV